MKSKWIGLAYKCLLSCGKNHVLEQSLACSLKITLCHISKWKLVKYIFNKHRTIRTHISLIASVCTPPQTHGSPVFFYFYKNFLSREILTGRAASQQNTEAVFLDRIRDVVKTTFIKLLPTPTWSSEGVKYNSKSLF